MIDIKINDFACLLVLHLFQKLMQQVKEVLKFLSCFHIFHFLLAVNEYLSSKPEKVIIDAIPFFQKGCKEPKLKNRQPMDKSSNYYEI